jgi:thiamine biosynthesis lipoprotein
VPASALLRGAVRAALQAAERSGGLVDPTLLDGLEDAGYRASRAGCAPADLRHALACAPPRRPAAAHPGARWRTVAVDDERATIRRPPGLRIDTAGTTKGLAADAAAARLAGCARYVVDCAGDLRVHVAPGGGAPHAVAVEHPLTGATAHVLHLHSGAVATSGLTRRLWHTAEGGVAHHLLDPATGRPAWTGLVSATALAPTAVVAETLAKAALLAGPAGARRLLGRTGGVLVHDDGAVEAVGRAARPRLRLRAAELVAA